jgi:hypothetical protein
VISDPNSTAQEMRLFVRRKVTGLCGKLEPQVQPGNSTDYAGGDRGIRTIAILATCGAPTIRLAGGRAFTVDNATDSVDVAQKLAFSFATNTLLGYRPKNLVHDGKWHKVKVKLPPLRVYRQSKCTQKTGYYAPSE